MKPMNHSRQTGATLIEVMVSALIVAFGILAMIALQSNAIKYNKTSEYRSVATLLANDLADRMRVNAEDGAMKGQYNLLAAYVDPTGTIPSRQDCAIPAACTPAELARRDLDEWRRALYFSLPGGNGYVQANIANRTVDIWVAWIDPAEAAAPVGDNGAVRECPAGFLPIAGAVPRCMYFRIGMSTPPPPPLP